MVKRSKISVAMVCVPFALLSLECSHSEKVAWVGDSPARSAPTLAWSRDVGIFSDMVMSEDGNSVFFAFLPDAAHGHVRYSFARWSLQGKREWEVRLNNQVKAMAVSADGQRSLISTYDDELIAFDAKGRISWRNPGLCRPMILNRTHRALCFHDDDSEPGIAFEVYDWSGRKIHTQKTDRDVLMMKTDPSETSLVLGFVGGQLQVLDAQFNQIWQSQVDGEIVDVSVSTQQPPQVAVVYSRLDRRAGKGRQVLARIQLGSSPGKALIQQAELNHDVEQVEISASGTEIYLYGNSSLGQRIAKFAVDSSIPTNASALSSVWDRPFSGRAAYSSTMMLNDTWVSVGVESPQRENLWLSLNREGELLWRLPLPTSEGAYLYAQSFSSRARKLALGSDDGRISVFNLNP